MVWCGVVLFSWCLVFCGDGEEGAGGAGQRASGEGNELEFVYLYMCCLLPMQWVGGCEWGRMDQINADFVDVDKS